MEDKLAALKKVIQKIIKDENCNNWININCLKESCKSGYNEKLLLN